MSKLFSGVDLSLNGTAVVIIDEQGKIISQIRLKTKSEDLIEDRLLFIAEKVISFLNSQKIERTYIEGLAYSSSGQSTMELAALHYIIRCAIFKERGLSYKIISPPTLKKFVSGVGNCKKNLMLLYTFKKFGEEFDDDNLCDAYCLSRLALDEHKKGITFITMNGTPHKGKKKQKFINNGNGHNHFRNKGGEQANGKIG